MSDIVSKSEYRRLELTDVNITAEKYFALKKERDEADRRLQKATANLEVETKAKVAALTEARKLRLLLEQAMDIVASRNYQSRERGWYERARVALRRVR